MSDTKQLPTNKVRRLVWNYTVAVTDAVWRSSLKRSDFPLDDVIVANKTTLMLRCRLGRCSGKTRQSSLSSSERAQRAEVGRLMMMSPALKKFSPLFQDNAPSQQQTRYMRTDSSSSRSRSSSRGATGSFPAPTRHRRRRSFFFSSGGRILIPSPPQ